MLRGACDNQSSYITIDHLVSDAHILTLHATLVIISSLFGLGHPSCSCRHVDIDLFACKPICRKEPAGGEIRFQPLFY